MYKKGDMIPQRGEQETLNYKRLQEAHLHLATDAAESLN